MFNINLFNYNFISFRLIISFIIINILASYSSYGQDKNEIEQVNLLIIVPKIENLEIESLIKNQEIYLPIGEIFNFLKIKNIVSANLQEVNGFFIQPKFTFSINYNTKQIIYKDKLYKLTSDDIILTESGLYLKSKYFGTVFELNFLFNYRNLAVVLSTAVELPAIQQMQQQLMRNNINSLNGKKYADTILPQKKSLLKIGIADWLVTATQATNFKNTIVANFNGGGILAGGELNVNLNLNNSQPFKISDQYYKWRYVNNNSTAISQLTLGRLFTPSTSTLYESLNGIQLTNAPTINRRVFGTYRISDKTEPGWIVELYINNSLVNYVKTDVSGFFVFDLPLLYGSSNIKLRFYGPWGEQQTREQTINIPFNFLPIKKLEYTFTAGILDDTSKSRFSRFNLNYGITKRITIGGGVEYLSSVMLGKLLPFVNASFRVGTNLMLFAQHSSGVQTKGTLSYRLPSNLQMDINYIHYNKGQTAIKFSYTEEKSIVISMPVRAGKFSAFSRFALNQLTFSKYKNTNAEFLISTVIAGLSTNITTYSLFLPKIPATIYSNFSTNILLPKSVRLTPLIQYQYNDRHINMFKVDIEKRLGRKAFVNLSYEKNLILNYSSLSVGFRYDCSFSQNIFSVRRANKTTATVESARGSLLYNKETNYIGFSNHSNIGTGGLIVSPFLDINCNGHRDAGEPKAFGLNIKSNGGLNKYNDKDTTTIITGLEAFTDFFLELDNTNFSNIAWQISKKTISIKIQPNILQVVEVPVAVVGEVSGTVYFNDIKGPTGMGRIIVNIFNTNNVLIKRMITEEDGYFTFIGLIPAAYHASLEDAQLKKLKMESPSIIDFKILPGVDGFVADGLVFTVDAIKLP